MEAVKKWTLSNHFVLSIDLHSGLMAIFYPYSRLRPADRATPITNYYLTPDNSLFEILAYSYAINHPSMNTSECNPLRAFGNDHYPVMNSAFYKSKIGTMKDWNYVFANCCLELSIHLSCCAYPPKETLKRHWSENKVSLVNHLRLVSKQFENRQINLIIISFCCCRSTGAHGHQRSDNGCDHQ